MKNVKRAIAAILMVIMALSVTACHKKNEIAVSVKDVEFTSAYYMCALINADSEAKSKVQENLTEEEQKAQEIDYYSKKIEDKDYETWVKDQALDSLKKIAAYKLLCKDNKVELTDEMKTEAETYSGYYWSSYGYAYYYEPNGVSQETYKKYMTDSYYAEAYFLHLYGKDGEKEVPAKDLKKEIHSNYIIADIIEASTAEMKDAEKKDLKKKLDGYVDALNDGTKTFKDVYNDYNNVKEEDKKEEHDHDEDEAAHPKDEYAQILGGEDTVYAHDKYETIKKMKTGKVKLIELDNDSGYMLVVKQDITKDDYYLEALDNTARHTLADEEYEKIIDEYKNKLELDVNKYAVNQFKVKKIVEPDYSGMQ